MSYCQQCADLLREVASLRQVVRERDALAEWKEMAEESLRHNPQLRSTIASLREDARKVYDEIADLVEDWCPSETKLVAEIRSRASRLTAGTGEER